MKLGPINGPMSHFIRKYIGRALVLATLLGVSAGSASLGFAQDSAAAGASAANNARVASAVAATLVEQARVGAAERTLTHASIPGGTLVLVAYGVLWAFIFAMIFLTLRRQQTVSGEVRALGRRMDAVFEDIEKAP